MGPMSVNTRKETTMYTATLTLGVLQGTLSSPVYFNVYIDDLMETSQRWTGRVAGKKVSLMILAYEVLVRAKFKYRLQRLLDTDPIWAEGKYTTCLTDKCPYMTCQNTTDDTMFRRNGEVQKKERTDTYNGIALSPKDLIGTKTEESIRPARAEHTKL